jgi:hypothetical protein
MEPLDCMPAVRTPEAPQEGDARRFLDAMRERFEAFSLSLHQARRA